MLKQPCMALEWLLTPPLLCHWRPMKRSYRRCCLVSYIICDGAEKKSSDASHMIFPLPFRTRQWRSNASVALYSHNKSQHAFHKQKSRTPPSPHHIHRHPCRLVKRHRCTLLQLFGIQLDQPSAIPLLLRDGKVPASLIALIGVSILFQIDKELCHLINMIRGSGIASYLDNVKCSQIIKELGVKFSRQFQQAHAFPLASFDNFIFHICQIVYDMVHIISQVQ